MDISSLEKAFSVANAVYIFAVAVAAVATFFVYFFASKLTVAKDDELTRFQNESRRAIAEANARAAESNARAAEANEKAEQERLARVKIEEKLAPRILTQEQKRQLIEAVKEFKGQKLEVIKYGPSREASSFSDQIQTALTEAGWEARITGIRSGVEPNPDVVVLVELGQESAASLALVNVLREIGIDTKYSHNTGFMPRSLETGAIGLFVGPKP